MAPSKNRKFIVQMYESEYRQIQGWVAKHQHVETGGDLFGLWAEDNTTVVQLVLGPGKHCRRSSVSFYQDVDYLERVGNILTTEEGLCHIGEWHSHHKLGLSRPSGGDENTVWTNMDRYGINRFFLFIATIGSSYNDVNVGCFLFEINPKTKRREPVLKGEIYVFGNEESPFRKSVKDHLAKGAESQNSSQYLEKFQSNVIKTNERASTDKRLWRDYDEQDHKKLKIHNTAECHTPVMTTDHVMEELNVNKVDHHQEDKSEDMKDKDTEKSGKLSQEEENQGNKLGCSLHVDEQSNLTQDDNKPETLKNQPSTPAIATEKNKHPSSSAKSNSKVTYLGGGFKNTQAKEKHEALHAEESKDGQATEETSSKNIIQHPKPNTIHVKPASEESNTNQGQPSNALDQNKNTTIEDGSELKGPEDELKDAQQNYIKQSSATEETKIDETRKLLPVKNSKSGCFPKKEKTAEEMREKKERKEKKNKEKEEKKKEKKERKEKKKEEKKKKKMEEKIEKKNKEEEKKKKKENKNKAEKDKKAKNKGKKESSKSTLMITSV